MALIFFSFKFSAIEPPPVPIVPPPPDIQPIIDKLAKYVAKNGDEFEASVRAKCDPRFEFLVPWHSYNAYYLAKKRMFVREFEQGASSEPDVGDLGSKGSMEKSKKGTWRSIIKTCNLLHVAFRSGIMTAWQLLCKDIYFLILYRLICHLIFLY